MFHPVPALGSPVALWDMLGAALPRGVLGLSDPDVHCIDGRWTMFIGGFSTTFRNRLYRATLPPGHDVSLTGWRLDASRRGGALALVGDPPRSAWDAGGMHTPCYVPAAHGQPARVYYAGRAGTRRFGPNSSYAIGVLTQSADGYERHPDPVMRGTTARPSVLEPRVIATTNGFRMWFLSTLHEVGPGEQPDFELQVADSPDGLRWGAPSRFASSSEGFFDNTLIQTTHGWEMLLARGTNLHATQPFPAQGLWWMRADQPAADRAAWSTPVQVLDTDDQRTAKWLGRGVCGPSVVAEGDDRFVFFTGTHRSTSWWREALARLASHRRLAVPAPYFLATGGARLVPAAYSEDPPC